jgi:uncharacterized protein YqeY
MSVHEELDGRLRAALKAKDERVLDVVRMIRSRAKTAAVDQNKELDDALYLETIGAYVKQMKRAATEYEQAGESGAAMVEKLRFEVDYLTPFLPSALGDDEVRALVKAIIAQQGIAGARMAGRLVGLVMKDHKGRVDPALVKRIAEEELA